MPADIMPAKRDKEHAGMHAAPPSSHRTCTVIDACTVMRLAPALHRDVPVGPYTTSYTYACVRAYIAAESSRGQRQHKCMHGR